MILFFLPSVINLRFFDKIVPMKKMGFGYRQWKIGFLILPMKIGLLILLARIRLLILLMRIKL